MKIVKLTTENIKNLKAVEIEPTTNMVMITGKNGAGKSSILDSIVYALCGKRAIPDKPIREGEKRAEITVELDGEKKLTVKRIFTKAGSRLEIKNAEGFKADKPQDLLDEIVGEISFSPTDFLSYPPAKRRSLFMELVGLDFTKQDEKISDLKTKRYDLKKERDRIASQIEGMPDLDKSVPDTKILVADVTTKLTEAMKHNAGLDILTGEKARIEQHIIHNKRDHMEVKEQIEQTEKSLISLKQSLSELKGSIEGYADALGVKTTDIESFEIIDIEAINDEIEAIETTNAAIDANERIESKGELLATVANEYKVNVSKIEKLEESKVTALDKAKMPVEGLSIDENDLLFEGVPLDQVNEAMRLRVAVSIGMALNPKLKVIRASANCLDADNLKMLAEMAELTDYQLWLEKVDDTGSMGIVIEDGMVMSKG